MENFIDLQNLEAFEAITFFFADLNTSTIPANMTDMNDITVI